jgi:hypothetical protein
MDAEVINLLIQISEDGDHLSRIELVSDKDFNNQTKAIIFFFEKQNLTIMASEEDTIEIECKMRDWDDSSVLNDVSCTHPWLRSIGKKLRWAWCLVNQQGYFDALQLEFANNVSEEPIIVQLVAVASCLRAYTLKEISANS